MKSRKHMTRDLASSMEAPLSGKSYRHAPDRSCLRVPILGLRRRKPPYEPETWCDQLPAPSAPPVQERSGWDAALEEVLFLGGLASLGPVMLGFVFLAAYGLICLASACPLALLHFFIFPVGLVAVLLAVVIAIEGPKYSVVMLDGGGMHLFGVGDASVRFIPYAAIRRVQTYLDEGVRGATARGVIVGVDGEQALTLELGENTGKVADTICHHTRVLARHSRCTWASEPIGF